MRILLVEDHEEIWDFLSRRLRRRGFEVVRAADGQAGVDKAGSEAPDILLLDMHRRVDGGQHDQGRRENGSHPDYRAHGPCHVGGSREGDRSGMRRLSSEAGRFLSSAGTDRGARREGRAGPDLKLLRPRAVALASERA